MLLKCPQSATVSRPNAESASYVLWGAAWHRHLSSQQGYGCSLSPLALRFPCQSTALWDLCYFSTTSFSVRPSAIGMARLSIRFIPTHLKANLNVLKHAQVDCVWNVMALAQKLIIEASRSHSDTARSVGLLLTRNQTDPETSTWQHTAQNPSPPGAGFEPAIPASEWPQTHALNRPGTGIG